MRLAIHSEVERVPFNVQGTLAVIVEWIGVPFWHLPVAMGVWGLATLAANSIILGSTVAFVLVALDRALIEGDHGAAREVWLMVRHGSWLADRTRHGGERRSTEMPQAHTLGPR